MSCRGWCSSEWQDTVVDRLLADLARRSHGCQTEALQKIHMNCSFALHCVMRENVIQRRFATHCQIRTVGSRACWLTARCDRRKRCGCFAERGHKVLRAPHRRLEFGAFIDKTVHQGA